MCIITHCSISVFILKAKPTEIGTGKETVSAEEGETVHIPCKVSQSPIGAYKTVWYNHGSPPVQIRTLTSSDNALVLSNVTDGYHEGSYYCAVHTDKPVQGTIVRSYLNGLVQLSIKKKFGKSAFKQYCMRIQRSICPLYTLYD